MRRIFFILILLSSCASNPPKGIPKITSEGLRDRTNVSIPTNNRLRGKDILLPPRIELSKKLSAEEAAAIALWNNPQYGADLTLLGLSRGDLIDAGQLRNPRLDILAPLGHKPFELLLNLPIEAIWERPARVEAAEKAYEQLAHSLIQNGLNTFQDALITHANFAAAKKREEILSRAVELRKRISKINNSQRFRSGEVTEAEGIATQVDSASSEDLWVRARHETYLARERFRFALGLSLSADELDVSSSPVNTTELPASEILVQKAFEKRPDLKSLEIGIIAAAKRAKWEDKRLSQLSLMLSSKGIGNYGVLTGPGFSAELPIFHQNQGRRERADAEVILFTQSYLALKHRIAFEVRESRELVMQAREILKKTETEVLPLLRKTVHIAENQYRHQTASYLFVLEQTRSLIDAELRAADAEAAVFRAEAQLRRASGGSL